MSIINAVNSIVWYYGSPEQGREVTINCKKVEEFTEETIGDKENQYEYHAIVILDFDGKMDISDEELLLIKDYCENRHYDLLYYGTAHMEQFRKNGFFGTRFYLQRFVLEAAKRREGISESVSSDWKLNGLRNAVL